MSSKVNMLFCRCGHTKSEHQPYKLYCNHINRGEFYPGFVYVSEFCDCNRFVLANRQMSSTDKERFDDDLLEKANENL